MKAGTVVATKVAKAVKVVRARAETVVGKAAVVRAKAETVTRHPIALAVLVGVPMAQLMGVATMEVVPAQVMAV